MAEMQIRRTSEGLPLPFTRHETEDPEEMKRLVAEWEASHGPYTHVLFECEPGILHAPRPATSVLLPRQQPLLLPAETKIARDHVIDIDRKLGGVELVRAEALPFFTYCLVPLACITERREDMWRGVPMRKVGVNTFMRCGKGGPRP